jgi:hypothetical protein
MLLGSLMSEYENNRVYQCLVIMLEGQLDNEILLLLEHLSTMAITSSLLFMSGKAAEKIDGGIVGAELGR